jgi:aerotaxis receptor
MVIEVRHGGLLMQLEAAPLNEEIKLEEDDFIVSKTDKKGRITYCNEIFIRISGYSENELLNQPHNIIRHPDMPKAVYRLMWQTLQEGQEFFGIVKNRCKNGSFYWTFANVSPSYDSDKQLLGYYSVRRKPNPEFVSQMDTLYKAMVAEEAKHANANEAMDSAIKLLTDLLASEESDYNQFVYTHAV